HVFATKQPDLNWKNQDMRQAVYEMINWWLDKGIDGFRVDAISHINKKEGFPDLPNPNGLDFVSSFDYHMKVEGIMEHLSE
ncbi:glucohydrolase, partial [Mycobacterium tuberculosis]|nr:glucohydrolase [Mycobacterium tuberculosis]